MPTICCIPVRARRLWLVGAALLAALCVCAGPSSAQPGKAAYAPPARAAMEAKLRQVPEVDLDPDFARKSSAQLAAAGQEIARQNADAHDAFVKTLIRDRGDLSGLPFILGKDCMITTDQADTLAEASRRTRTALAEAPRMGKWKEEVEASAFSGMDPITFTFWKGLGRFNAQGVSALHQIVCVEKSDFRLAMIRRVQHTTGPRATGSLVKMALYDLDADVRSEAIGALSDRPKEEYRAEVLNGFRYPWAPVAHNAAAAVVALAMKDSVPALDALLKEPDPAAPFVVKTQDGKEKTMIRELVRVNHHRNCMLCHPPIGAAALADPKGVRAFESIPVGPVTSMHDELPPSSTIIYYSPRPGIILVRADITYLRQDFSLQQKVKDHGKWPEMQRFDFFVRVREMTATEQNARVAPQENSPYTQALQLALDGLTKRTP